MFREHYEMNEDPRELLKECNEEEFGTKNSQKKEKTYKITSIVGRKKSFCITKENVEELVDFDYWKVKTEGVKLHKAYLLAMKYAKNGYINGRIKRLLRRLWW